MIEFLKTKVGAVTLVLASAVLLTGIWGPGLWDPWEMNQTFLGRRLSDLPPVLVMEKGPGAAGTSLSDTIRAALGDEAEVVSTWESRSSGSPLQAGRTMMAGHVFPVAVLDADSEIKGADDSTGIDRLARSLESIIPANLSTVIILVSRGGVLDVAALRETLVARMDGAEGGGSDVGEETGDAPTIGSPDSIIHAVPSLDDLPDEVSAGLSGDAYTAQFKRNGTTVFMPPLNPYLVSLSLRTFGQSEFSARLPGVLLAILLMALVFFFARGVFGPGPAAVAVLVMATSPLFFGSARFVANQMPTALGLAAGAVSLVWAVRGVGLSRVIPLLSASMLVLYLGEGMTAVVTMAAMAGVYPLVAADTRRGVVVTAVAALTIAGLLALITFVPDGAFFRQFRFTATTFAGGMRTFSRSFDFALKEVGFGMFPWSALLPLSVMAVVSRGGGEPKPERLVLILWAVAPLVALMITVRPMHHYLYAGLPALAILTAIYVSEAEDDGLESRLLAFFGFGLFLVMMKDLVLHPAPLVTFLTTDPMFSKPGKGDLQFPPEMRLPTVIKIVAILSGVSLVVGGGKLVSFLASLPGRLARGKTFRVVMGVMIGLVLLDLIIFLALKWETISGADRTGAAAGAVLLRIFLTGPDILALYAVTLGIVVVRHASWCRRTLERVVPTAWIDRIGGLFMTLERPKGFFTVMGAGAVVLSLSVMFWMVPELSYHLSQKHIIETYRESASREPGELYRHGVFASRGSEDSNFYTAQVKEMAGRSEVIGRLLDRKERTFFIVPKNQWSEINSSFRKRSRGVQALLLDDRSSRFVLAASSLAPGEVDRNWIADATLDQAGFEALGGVKPSMVNFDDKIELVGYSLDAPAVRRGGVATLKMYFKCTNRVPVSYRVFMHIDRVGSSSRIHGDHWILNLVRESEEQKSCVGCFATTHWLKGDIVVDTYRIKVPIGSPSGPYNLWMGFYAPGGGKRLRVKDWDKSKVRNDGNNRVSIGIMTVE